MVRNGHGLSKIAGSLAHNTYRIGDEGGNVMFEWFFENMTVTVIGIVLSIIGFALWAYQYAAIKYNLPIWKWLKNLDQHSPGGPGPGGP